MLMRTINDVFAADVAATRGSVDVVGRIADSDLSRPTPCAEWDLRALVAHMTAQHRGFAAAAEGGGADLALWRPTAEAEPVKAYAEAAEAVIAAFAAAKVAEMAEMADRDFVLPELGRTVPGRLAVGFHLIDYVVHGWDVARALEVAYEPDQDLLDLSLPIARAVPGGAARSVPGAAFAPGLAAPAGSGTLDEILLLLGRDPRWRPILS